MAEKSDRLSRKRPRILAPDVVIAEPAPTIVAPANPYGTVAGQPPGAFVVEPAGRGLSEVVNPPVVTTPTEAREYEGPYGTVVTQPPGSVVVEQSPGGIKSVIMGDPDAPAINPSPEVRSSPDASTLLPDFWKWLTGGDSEEGPEKEKPKKEETKAPDGTVIAAPPAPTDAGVTPGMSLEEYLQFLEQLYGDQTYVNPAQDRADAEAERMRGRTAMLAQLALAGGMAKGAGKSWEGLGQGFLDAASVYDRGFSRYQAALQNSADRYSRDLTRQQTLGLAKKNAALQLWSAERSDIRTEARAAAKERRASIDKYFEKEGDIRKDAMLEPGAMEDWLKRWERSKRENQIYPPGSLDVDVADK